MSWDLLNKTYKEDGIVPVLGAGVSARSGLPEWTELLRRVGEHCATDGRALVDELCREGFSLPAVASMLRTMCPPGENFTELVRRELYRTLPAVIRNAQPNGAAACVASVQHDNSTLRAVAALCAVSTGSPAQFVRNPLVHGVVTFNLDAVLREYVEARYGRALVRSVERTSKERHPDRINLYYMHGFLRFDSKAGMTGREGADKLVLAEQEYFDFFNNPTGLFNYTFLYLLREHSCLFIGASMKDDNIRRLLHYSTKERMRAFEEEGKISEAKTLSVRHFAILKSYRTSEINDAVARSLRAIGTHTLWITDFDELPTRLGTMYANAGQNWEAVK